MLDMYTRTSSRLVVLIGGFLIGSGSQVFAQGTTARPTLPSSRDSNNGSLRTDNAAQATETMARGVIAMADGSVPQELVEIHSVCSGASQAIAVADAKGRFSFNPGVLTSIGDTKGCVLRASLEGYKSEDKPLAEVNANSGTKLGKIVLQPLSSDTAGLHSANDAQASKNAKKAFDKGLDDAAKQDWSGAAASFQKATAAYPDYSSAWLSLGVLRQSSGNRDEAMKAFAEAARADGKFALPLIRMAALEATKGDWPATVDHSQKAIDLNPGAFPHAYDLNAIGNLNLQKIDIAEKSATEGLKLDTSHQYPDLEYALGMALKAKNDRDGSVKHLQAYLDEAPKGPNAPAVKKELSEFQSAR